MPERARSREKALIVPVRDMRRNPFCVNANAEDIPKSDNGLGSFWRISKMYRSYPQSCGTFKGQKGHIVIGDFLTPRYVFKAFPLFVGKFQPFEFKTDFSVFSALILSSPVFKVTTR